MTETQTLCNGRWLRLMRRGRWEYAERTNPGGGVIIIAVTPEDRILFVEQWREAVRSNPAAAETKANTSEERRAA